MSRLESPGAWSTPGISKAFLDLELVGRSLHPAWVDGILASQKKTTACVERFFLKEISVEQKFGGMFFYFFFLGG